MHSQGQSVDGSGAEHRQAGANHIPCAGVRIRGVMVRALHLVGLGLTCVWRGGGSSSSGGRGLHTRPHRPPGPGSKAAAVVAARQKLQPEAAPAFPHRSRGPSWEEPSVLLLVDWTKCQGS